MILRNNIFRGRAVVPRGRVLGANAVLALQRSAGNRATGKLLSRVRVPGITVQRDDRDAPTVASPLRRKVAPLPANLWLKNPEEFLRNQHLLAPKGGLPPLPPFQVEGLIDWGDIGTAYRERRLLLETRDHAVIVGHWQRWYPLARALSDNPAALMNWMTAKMIDSSLAGERPDIIELFDRGAEQFGVKTRGPWSITFRTGRIPG